MYDTIMSTHQSAINRCSVSTSARRLFHNGLSLLDLTGSPTSSDQDHTTSCNFHLVFTQIVYKLYIAKAGKSASHREDKVTFVVAKGISI